MASNIDTNGIRISQLPSEMSPSGVYVPGVKSERTVKISLDLLATKDELQNAVVGTNILGERADVSTIKLEITAPNKGDTYKALDTGNYWKYNDTISETNPYDPNKWIDIGNIIPSDVALSGGSTLTMQDMDNNKLDKGTYTGTASDLNGKKAERINDDGNEVVYAPNGTIDLSDYADKVNTDGDQVVYFPDGVIPMATTESSGLMSSDFVNLLNELKKKIDMSLISDRYANSIYLKFNNDAPMTLSRGININSTDPEIHIDNNGFIYKLENVQGQHEIPLLIKEPNGYIKIYYNGTAAIYTDNIGGVIDEIQVTGPNVNTLSINGNNMRQVDASALSLMTSLYAGGSNLIEYYNFSQNKSLQNINCEQSPKLTGMRIHGATEQNISVAKCLTFTEFIIGLPMDSLESLDISGTAVAVDTLLAIESQWTSRVGLDAGVLTLDTVLYNQLTTDQQVLFTNKNITFNLV